MNTNIMNIMNVLPIPKVQPVGRSSAQYANKAQDFDEISQQNNLPASNLSQPDDIQLQSNPRTNDIDSSDNAPALEPINSKHNVSHFKNILNKKIKSDNEDNEESGKKVQDKTIDSDSSDNGQAVQVQPIDILNLAVSVSANQQQSEAEATVQTNQDVTDTLNLKDNSPQTNAQATKTNEMAVTDGQDKQADNQQQVIQQVVKKSDQPVLETIPVKQPVEQTPVSIKDQVPEVQQSTEKAPQQPQTTNNQQVQTNNTPTTVVNSDVKQINIDLQQQQQHQTPVNPNNTIVNETAEIKSTDSVNQSSTVQSEPALPKEQSVTPLEQANIAVANAEQPIEPKPAKTQRSGAQRQNTNTAKDNSSANKVDGQQNDEGNRNGQDFVTGGLAQRLGVDKVELVNGKDGSPNSNPVNFATLISHGNLAANGSTPVNAGNRPVTIETTGTTAGNDTTQTSACGDLNDTAASIREQINQSIQTASQQGNKEITVQLHPPEFGRISIKFTEKGAELSGVIETANPQTRAEIRNSIPEIMRSLEQSGINIKRIDVTLSDLSDKSGMSRQSNQNTYRDNYSQQLWDRSGNSFQEHSQGQSRSHYDSFTTSSYLNNSSDSPAISPFSSYSQPSSANQFNSSKSSISEALDVLI